MTKLLRNYSSWSTQGCLKSYLGILILGTQESWAFLWGEGVKVQFNVLAEGRQAAAHHKSLFAPPFLPQPTLIKTPQFLPLYSLNFSKNQKHQAIFLLFYLNHSSVWADVSDPPWGKCKHKDNVKRVDSRSQTPPGLAQTHSSTGLSPKPRLSPVLHSLICFGISLWVNWKVECGWYILT